MGAGAKIVCAAFCCTITLVQYAASQRLFACSNTCWRGGGLHAIPIILMWMALQPSLQVSLASLT